MTLVKSNNGTRFTRRDNMSKRIRGWSEGEIARYIKDGRGAGELASYKPWLTLQNVRSKGNFP